MINMITKTSIPRRTVLRGLGATIALPLLDAMAPALAAQSALGGAAVRRLSLVYVGMGAAVGYWAPKGEGTAFEMSRILKPLEPFRDNLCVVSGLDNAPALQLLGEPAGGHGRIAPAFLSGVHAKPTESTDIRAGVTIDQIAASHLRGKTELSSLELSLCSPGFAGTCETGFSCAYTNTLCWRTPTTPVPMENNPRAVFERMFGDSGSTEPAVRLAQMRERRSILDSVSEKVARLRRKLGPQDRGKVADYMEAIRDVERRIETAEAHSDRELPLMEQPPGIPAAFEAHAKLMYDLQVLAFQSDLTRVITFMTVGEITGSRAYPEIGVPDGHHELTHAQGDPANVEKLAKINTYHAQIFAHYLDKLRSTPDGDGSLLDHVMVLYGSGMHNANLHEPLDLPLLLAGGRSSGLRGGRHIRYAKGTPLTNLWLTLLGKMDVPMERIGDSTGALHELSGV